MGRARIRKTKQAVKGPQSSVTSKQIPREVPQPAASQENSIFITGLPTTISEELLFRTLQDEFSNVGKIEVIEIMNLENEFLTP
ncbi:unnamed protein product [Rotaria sp. Silwood1]|nr:unnamed protein product [Rotaria sp. Silwood1]CAF1601030.1 unnamed protein product [Rotaria sp. Silwood1]CAF3661553.1 unnamed protein product [Rotaria sp. Silwood1]CAF3680285.1 unnamed protein product [Rotaria sp. Silwood1]CAF3701377.1 unnamed protein product [Rotaria sp. Silwood1]